MSLHKRMMERIRHVGAGVEHLLCAPWSARSLDVKPRANCLLNPPGYGAPAQKNRLMLVFIVDYIKTHRSEAFDGQRVDLNESLFTNGISPDQAEQLLQMCESFKRGKADFSKCEVAREQIHKMSVMRFSNFCEKNILPPISQPEQKKRRKWLGRDWFNR